MTCRRGLFFIAAPSRSRVDKLGAGLAHGCNVPGSASLAFMLPETDTPALAESGQMADQFGRREGKTTASRRYLPPTVTSYWAASVFRVTSISRAQNTRAGLMLWLAS